jgi:hypothetical protein
LIQVSSFTDWRWIGYLLVAHFPNLKNIARYKTHIFASSSVLTTSVSFMHTVMLEEERKPIKVEN